MKEIQNKLYLYVKKNGKLQSELSVYKQKEERNRNISWWATKKFTELLLGKDLNTSIKNGPNEYSESKSLSKDTLSDLIASLIRRFVRVGFITLLLALFPTGI